jgi:hypothetical protein
MTGTAALQTDVGYGKSIGNVDMTIWNSCSTYDWNSCSTDRRQIWALRENEESDCTTRLDN